MTAQEDFLNSGRRPTPICAAGHSRSLGGGRWSISTAAEFGILFQSNGIAKYRLRCLTCGQESTDVNQVVATRLIQSGSMVEWVRDNSLVTR